MSHFAIRKGIFVLVYTAVGACWVLDHWLQREQLKSPEVALEETLRRLHEKTSDFSHSLGK
jgi:hypothetical protein